MVSASLDGTVRVWDVEAGNEVQNLKGHQGQVLCVAASPDGNLAVSGGGTPLFDSGT